MSGVRGVYEAKISTTFASIEEAVKDLEEHIDKSKHVRFNSVPSTLVSRLVPVLKGKDVKVIFPSNENPGNEFKNLFEYTISKSRTYRDFKGIEAYTGAIYLPDRVYNITWVKDRILEVETIEYDRCVGCMREMFEQAWKCSRR